jgi:tetratricopeptide (TPR) repeat protein
MSHCFEGAALSALKKFLAFTVPVSLAAMLLAPGPTPPASAASDISSLESPAELRLTALDTLMKGDKHKALALYEDAIRLATQQFGADSSFLGDLYYETGRLSLELNQFNQAEEYLRQAVQINPKNASARLCLAKLLDTRAKVQESIGQIREALMVNPNSPVARQKFIQTLSKYGTKPSDKAIATEEAYTVAMMQKASRDMFARPASSGESKPAAKAKTKKLAIPTMPKNLKPLKDDENTDGAGESQGVQSHAAPPSATGGGAESKSSSAAGTAPSTEKPAFGGFSLFPLKDMSQRKKQEDLEKAAREQQEKAAGEPKAVDKKETEKKETVKKEGGKKKVSDGDIVQKLKEQVRQHEKTRAAEKAAKAAKAAKVEPKATKVETKITKVESKPETKTETKPAAKEDKAAKPEAKAAKAESKPAEQPAQQPAQQAAPQMMQQYYPQPMYQPVFSPPPKGKPGKGFVPPPPPLMPVFGGMQVPVMPQVIPAQQPKPAPAKPKVEKPKPAPESKPAEDKPPPMTTTGEAADPDFLLDWGGKTGKKKGK